MNSFSSLSPFILLTSAYVIFSWWSRKTSLPCKVLHSLHWLLGWRLPCVVLGMQACFPVHPCPAASSPCSPRSDPWGPQVQPHSSREFLLLWASTPATMSGSCLHKSRSVFWQRHHHHDDCVKRPLPQNAIPKLQFCQVLLFLASPGSYLSSLSLLTVSDSAFIPVIVECQSPYLTIGLSPHLAWWKCP